jgi:hypothetical protein
MIVGQEEGKVDIILIFFFSSQSLLGLTFNSPYGAAIACVSWASMSETQRPQLVVMLR